MKWRYKAVLFLILSSARAWASETLPVETERLPDLPAPMSNNAVALIPAQAGVKLFSFFGLEGGKGWQNLSGAGWELKPGAESWQSVEALPDMEGRLAAAAVTLHGQDIWVFGGYTVSASGEEVSRPEVFRLSLIEGRLEHATDMPVPVDDMVALVYRDRYIYLVSGWHDLGNVNLVQVLDMQTLQWSMATPYPGEPVFGHVGALVQDTVAGEDKEMPVLLGAMLICDGVRIEYPVHGSARRFLPSNECWKGEIDPKNFRRIAWSPAPPHPGRPRYRAAAGTDGHGRIVFIGGSANPYNYDGVGYDGVPSEPETTIFRFNFNDEKWESAWEWSEAGMDYRSLPYYDGWFYMVGGMTSGQTLTRRVLRLRLPEPDSAN